MTIGKPLVTDYLATKAALAEDAYIHGYKEIKKFFNEDPEFLVLLFCNGATVLSKHIDEAIEVLRKRFFLITCLIGMFICFIIYLQSINKL